MREHFKKESPMVSLISLGGGGTGLAIGGGSGSLYPADSYWISVATRGNWDNEYTEKLDWDIDGNIYVNNIRYSAGGSGYKGGSVTKYAVDGSVSWQKVQYKTSSPYPMETRVIAAELDGDHIYTAGQSDSGMFFCKMNKSDGTVDWRRYLGSSSNPNNNPHGAAIGSDGNPIFICRWDDGDAEQAYFSINASDGSANFSTMITRNAGDPETQSTDTCHPKIDSSGNIHTVANARISGTSNYYCSVVKHNSSGTLQSISDYITSNRNEDKFTDVAIDSSGNKYITSRHYTGSGYNRMCVLKVNSSDAIQWQTSIVSSSNALYPEQIEITPDESAVVLRVDDRQSSSANAFVRLNTSDGTEVWKRQLTCSGVDLPGSSGRMRLNRNGNIINNTYYSSGGQTYTVVAQLPGDGSLTGNYTASGHPQFSWSASTNITVTASQSIWTKQSSSAFSAGSVTPSNNAYSNVTQVNNVQTFSKVDVT